MAFEHVIRARCDDHMKARVLRLLRQPEHRGRDEADLLRIATEDLLDKEEARLRIKPMTPSEVQEYLALALAERSGPASPKPRPPKGPVNYRKSKPHSKGKTHTPGKQLGPSN